MFDLYFWIVFAWFSCGVAFVAALLEIKFNIVSKLGKKKGYKIVTVGHRDLRPVQEIIDNLTDRIINDK